MSLCLPLPRHAEATTLSTTASACLLRPRIRLRLGLGSCRAAANALAAASPDAATGLARGHGGYHASVAAFSPRTSYSPPPDGGGGFLLLTVAASAVAISTSVVFFSAIHSLLDCKRTAESLEKSFDSTREKLPETMASVRLVGREVSDLAVDLSDLSQELRMGVKSSMSVVHTAEAQLHQLTSPAPQGTLQRVANRKKGTGEPLLASTVREFRELIADIRSGFGVAFGIASLFMWASNFASKRPKNRS